MQRLQKFVDDIAYIANTGATDALTKQPLDGKGSHGGFRLGEMEGWSTIASGASRFYGEKIYDHSAGKETYICHKCGTRAVVNEALNIYKCDICRDDHDIQKVNTSWTSKVMMQELNAINIGTQFKLAPYTYYS
jgi:DNA-directed RNA polymerase II subunit RPB2